MNEPGTMCSSACNPEIDIPKESVQNKLFYNPGNTDLNSYTAPIDIKHDEGELEIDAHSSYGHLQSKATFDYFK